MLRSVAVTVATFVIAAPLRAQPKPPEPPRAVEERNGKLVYATDDRGNRIPDFSTCGYRGGDVPIPDVPVRIVVPPIDGDDTARVQAALDHVASLAPDQSGFRGAVLLQPGRFEIGGALKIAASGVVLRGSDMGEGGSTLVATGHDRRTLISIAGRADRAIDAGAVAITDQYAPVPTTRFRVADAPKFKVADTVVASRPCTAGWVKALGTDSMGGERHGFSWKPGSRELMWDRTVTKVEGDQLAVDAALTTAIDAKFGGGTVAKYAWPGRITTVGVENVRCESAFD